MAPQGAPEMPKWAPRMSKRKHQSPQMAIPRSQNGLAAEGVARKIIQEKVASCLKHVVFRNLKVWDIALFDFVGKAGAEISRRSIG